MTEHTRGEGVRIGEAGESYTVYACEHCGKRWPCRGSLEERIAILEAQNTTLNDLLVTARALPARYGPTLEAARLVYEAMGGTIRAGEFITHDGAYAMNKLIAAIRAHNALLDSET